MSNCTIRNVVRVDEDEIVPFLDWYEPDWRDQHKTADYALDWMLVTYFTQTVMALEQWREECRSTSTFA